MIGNAAKNKGDAESPSSPQSPRWNDRTTAGALSSVAVLHVLGPDLEEFFQFAAAQGAGGAELARGHHNLGVVLHGFHSHISAADIFTIGNNAMVRHEDSVMERD